MLINRRKRARAEDSSALSDLAFLLIIYFIVIAGFNVNKGFLMNLPAKDSARLVLKDDIVRCELDETGAIVSGGQTVTAAAFRDTLRSTLADRPNLALILAVDGRCPWQYVVSFVEMAQSLRIDSFSFSIKANTDEAGGRDENQA
jgi:biopolymer transport protein ExbD